MPQSLARLVGQHPAALRAVLWRPKALESDEMGHLEIETKHGHVVVIDHANGTPFANPPEPPAPAGPRQTRDLTAQAQGAFDGRPVITMLTFDQGAGAWVVGLSSGVEVVFSLDRLAPRLAVQQRRLR